MSAFRITNVSNISTQSRGFFLDLGVDNGGKHIGVGQQIVLEAKTYDLLPGCIHDWAKQSFIRVVDLDKEGGVVVGGFPVGGELTPGTVNPISEARGEDDMDGEPDLSDAVDARTPSVEHTGPIAGDMSQMSGIKTRITDAAAEERYSKDLSPIPGETPKNLDDTEQFTVRAPRSKHPGSVIGKSK